MGKNKNGGRQEVPSFAVIASGRGSEKRAFSGWLPGTPRSPPSALFRTLFEDFTPTWESQWVGVWVLGWLGWSVAFGPLSGDEM